MKPFIHIQYTQPQGFNGGTLCKNQWTQVPFNTLVKSTMENAVLSCNTIELDAGGYLFTFKDYTSIHCFKNFRINVLREGSIYESGVLGGNIIDAIICYTTLPTRQKIKFEMCVPKRITDTGLGEPLNLKDHIEVYKELYIEKVDIC